LIELTAYFRLKDGFITFKIPEGYLEQVKLELATLKTDQAYLKFGKPKKPRTIGEGSQNSHAWGHCTEIARALGNEVYEIEYIAKVRAIKRGYPVSICLGLPVVKSQSDIDTVECGYLIDEYHQIAAENGIRLTENEPEIKAERVKAWSEMTRAEQAISDPERFDAEMQLEIF